jgi:hypothetical protein
MEKDSDQMLGGDVNNKDGGDGVRSNTSTAAKKKKGRKK